MYVFPFNFKLTLLQDHTSILNKMWSEDAIRRMQEQPSETAGRLSSKTFILRIYYV